MPDLPPPTQVAKLAAYTDADRFKNGSGYLTAVHQNAAYSGNRAVYSPSWDPDGSPLPADLAYAAYALNIEGYDLAADLFLRWSSAPQAANAWVGVSHWPADTWEFFPSDGSGEYSLGAMDNYINDAGLFAAVVVVAGLDQCILDCLRLGPLIGVWEIETVDMMMPHGISLAIDSTNKPHIAYQTSTPDGPDYWVSYAYFDAQIWDIQNLDDTGHEALPPSVACLDLDSADQPHVMFNDMTTGDWLYTYFDGSAWQALDMAGLHGASSMVLDADDRPHIAYTGGGLHYAWHNRTEWLSEEIGADLPVIMPDVALSGSSTPHIAYYNWEDDHAALASFVEGEWEYYNAPCITNGTAPDAACMSTGMPAFTFYNSSAQELWYEYFVKGSGWQHQVPDSDGNVGKGSSLAFDSLNHPHISYYDQDNYDLKYAYLDGIEWHIQTIEGNGIISGDISSIAIDSYDRPSIAFRGYEPPDGHYDQLRYARRID